MTRIREILSDSSSDWTKRVDAVIYISYIQVCGRRMFKFLFGLMHRVDYGYAHFAGCMLSILSHVSCSETVEVERFLELQGSMVWHVISSIHGRCLMYSGQVRSTSTSVVCLHQTSVLAVSDRPRTT